MTTTQVAIYARVSSDQQAVAHTIASQVAALRERVTADGLVVPEAMQFLDEGYSGATLVRPALERLRDVAAAGVVDRLYVHSPDRLARNYAYQVLLVDELRRAGVEVLFLNRALGQSPEDDLLLQVQGMIAEYERAKIIERHRRGKRHAARAGAVNVLSGAPYGYRYLAKYAGGGQARYDLVPEEARVVRQVFDWVARDRLSIGEVCRRLTQAGEVTRTGKTVWDRSAVWGMLKNPAYRGTAAFGKTRQEPLRPRLRTQRRRPPQPRRAITTVDVPQEEWLLIPVPALVDPDVFAAVQEQLRENQRHARQSRRGALYLLQGLVQCQQCGYAYYGKRVSPSARKGTPRVYAYYRCLGTDAYRFGGERVCQNTQVRTDLLDLAVWQEVCTLLAHPERLAEEYRHRLQPATGAQRTSLATVEEHIGKLRQGVARLIDSYAEGLLDKPEFEPRLLRLRQRIARLEEQRQQLADEAAVHAELQLIIGRLEDFAAKVHHGLEAPNWASQRDLIRTLVKRVEVARNEVNIVFRVNPYPGDTDPEKKSLQLCRGSDLPTLRCPLPCGPHFALFHHAGLEKLRDEVQDVSISNLAGHQVENTVVRDTVKESFEISIHHHAISLLVQLDELRHGRVATATPAKAMRAVMKGRFKDRFDQGTNDLLGYSTPYGGDS
jgi:site-specific DNA recombinase